QTLWKDLLFSFIFAGTPVHQARAGTPVHQARAGTPVHQARAGTPVHQARAGIPVHQARAVLNTNCTYPLIEFKNGSCQPPCDWSFMTSSEMKIYDYIMSNCLRIAMISTVITSLTWLAYKPL
ncbi:Hypothetical predicted protein, partial [Paramuricea clavata]